VAHPSRFDAAHQGVDHASLIGAEIVGRDVWRNQEVGGFGSRKGLANETGILDIADAALRTSFGLLAKESALAPGWVGRW
jgi:hypothetical protein